MRQDKQHGCVIEYPEARVFAGDNNYVIISADSAGVGAAIHATGGGNTASVEYTSELAHVEFNLNSMLQSLELQNNAQVKITIDLYAGGTGYVNALSFTFLYIYGKTVARAHGNTRIIRVYDATTVQVYTPAGANLYTWRGTHTGVSQQGIVSLAMPADEDEATCLIQSNAGMTVGDLWGVTTTTAFAVRVQRVCMPEHGIVIRYYDTDGCQREAVGEIMSTSTQVAGQEYRSGLALMRNIPHRLVTEQELSVTVVFKEVERLQYLDDILLSRRVWTTDYQGNELELIPVDTSLDETAETQDITMKFKYLS